MSSSYIANYVKPQMSKPGIVKDVHKKRGDSQSRLGVRVGMIVIKIGRVMTKTKRERSRLICV
jgi:hypothetical protein